MTQKQITITISSTLVLLISFSIFMTGINYKNTEIDLRNQAIAQQESNKVTFDKVWKVIKQKASIADKYANDFKNIFGGLMASRYEGDTKGAPMFKWIQERNPDFSIELYKELSIAIESNRSEFLRVQNRLIDIKREHDNIRLKFPGSIFVGSKPELDIQLVTSGKTENTFKTGKEDNADLF